MSRLTARQLEEELLRERQLVRQMHLQLTAIITALGHGVCEVAFDELPARVAMLMDELGRTARQCNENAKGWKDARECLDRVAAERDRLVEDLAAANEALAAGNPEVRKQEEDDDRGAVQ